MCGGKKLRKETNMVLIKSSVKWEDMSNLGIQRK